MGKLVNISIDWTEKLQFIATNDLTDTQVIIEAPSEEGKPTQGTTAKQLFLQGLASCTAGVVIYLLEKMRAGLPEKFKVDISGQLTNDHPMYFETIDVTYTLEGNISEEKIKKVIQMSEEKYCGLTYMLREVAKFNVRVIYNGNDITI
ncbi:MAG: OsmC family protein [Lentimicrobium sp.]|jgi:putative redox protein|nr:OsmC family protein [Lentimicrobium sp.]